MRRTTLIAIGVVVFVVIGLYFLGNTASAQIENLRTAQVDLMDAGSLGLPSVDAGIGTGFGGGSGNGFGGGTGTGFGGGTGIDPVPPAGINPNTGVPPPPAVPTPPPTGTPPSGT